MDNTASVHILYEGDDFSVYRIQDDDGEIGFDVTFFDTVTLHFLKEEWNDFLEIMKSLDFEADEK